MEKSSSCLGSRVESTYSSVAEPDMPSGNVASFSDWSVELPDELPDADEPVLDPVEPVEPLEPVLLAPAISAALSTESTSNDAAAVFAISLVTLEVS